MRKKLGDWILDVAKYLATVGILAPILKFGDVHSAVYYSVVFFTVVFLVCIGLFFTEEENNKSNKTKRRRK